VRVQRTFAFLDLCGFTAFTDAHGDAEAVTVLSQLRAVLRTEAENWGVRVTKWLGDGAMLSGVEAAAVVSCSVAVRDRLHRDGRLALRGGICEGPVIMFEGDDYIGAAVNVAARLCARAAPGQLLITGPTAVSVPEHLTPVPLGELPIDGISQVVDVLALNARPDLRATG
jgi:adenylate cyclase